MDPNNNPIGIPNNANNFNNFNNANNFASNNSVATEMQAAIVADQTANPSGQQPQENPMTAAEPVVNKGSGKGMLMAVVVFALLAVGGIGFGVWEMMDGNKQQENLNQTIDKLKETNSKLNDQIEELNKKIETLQKEAMNNSNNSNNNNSGDNSGSNNGNGNSGNGSSTDNDTSTVPKYSAEIIEGRFFVKNSDGEIVAKDDVRKVKEIMSCDVVSTLADPTFRCSVMTYDGEGVYVYDINSSNLSFTFSS